MVTVRRGVRIDVDHAAQSLETAAQFLGDVTHALVVVSQDLDRVVRSAPAPAVERRTVPVHPHVRPGEGVAERDHLFLDDGRELGILDRVRECDAHEAERLCDIDRETLYFGNRLHAFLEVLHELVAALQVRAPRKPDLNRYVRVLTPAPTPHGPRVHVSVEEVVGATENCGCQRYRDPRESDGEGNQVRIESQIKRLRPRARIRRGRPPFFADEEARRQRGNEREGNEERGHEREGDDDRQRHVKNFQLALQVDEGHEYDQRRRGGRQNREHHFAGSHFGSRGGILPALPASVHVLQDHDRVVDDEAEPQRQPHEREQIERESPEVDQIQGNEYAERDGSEDECRRAERAQESQQHEEDHHGAEARPVAQVRELTLDLLALVVLEYELGAEWLEALELREAHLDCIRGTYRVHADVLEDLEANRRLAVDTRELPGLFVGVEDGRDVTDTYRRSAHGGDYGVADVLRARRAVHDGDRPFEISLADHTRLTHEVEIGDRPLDRHGIEPEGTDRLFVELDLESTITPAEYTNLRDAVDLCDFRRYDVVEVRSQRLERIGTGERVHEERAVLLLELLGHVLAHQHLSDAGRKRLFQRRDSFRQIQAREVHVGVALEEDVDLGGARPLDLVRRRDDALDATDLLDRGLEGRGQERLHGLRRGPGPTPRYAQPRQTRVRQHLDRDIPPRGHAEKRHGGVRHRYRHRPTQAHTDHGVSPPPERAVGLPPRSAPPHGPRGRAMPRRSGRRPAPRST